MTLLYGAFSKQNHLGLTELRMQKLSNWKSRISIRGDSSSLKTIERKSHVDPGVLTARYAIAPR